jgi:hypothetical protein
MKKLSRLLPLLCLAATARAEFTSLNMGLDYRLRGVAIGNNDGRQGTADRLNYYSQSARFYVRSWLNQDVEASFRLQSINVWGLEGVAAPATRYPNADGSPWVEEAYVHLPNVLAKRVDLTIGRQPLVIGDGLIVSDDQLGFNALRAKAKLPWKLDADLFTAKAREGLSGAADLDVSGVTFGTDREHNRWELSWIEERHGAPNEYLLNGATTTATRLTRRFYDLRLFGNLKDAYYKIEVAKQGGNARLADGTGVTLEGLAQKLELGAQADTVRFGRFGVRAAYAVGSGDDNGTPGRDESFRPTFAQRWNGLQRTGYGQHFAATLSDAYDPAAPFSPTATGLPAGASGIKTIGFGLFSVQKVLWTGSLDYYTYESRTKLNGLSDIGSEFDVALTYRYTGFVTFQLGAALFFPGELYGTDTARVTRLTAETHVHF